MTEIKHLEAMLHELHAQRHTLEQCRDEDGERLTNLWQRIHQLEADLEAARVALGFVRRAK
jgi:hypothetical protein